MICERTSHFITTVGNLLERGDLSGLAAAVQENWSLRQLRAFLHDAEPIVARLAARCLGIAGTQRECPDLMRLLGSDDPGLSAAAEDALWGIWMRAGSPAAVAQLSVAVARIRDGAYEQAIGLLKSLIRLEPAFAEAHHQLALAQHSCDREREAERSYRAAVQRNPFHFAALCGLGHLAVARDDLATALKHYRRALRIHPRLPEIAEIVPQLDAALARRDVA